jgi:hypothetical protein
MAQATGPWLSIRRVMGSSFRPRGWVLLDKNPDM